MDEQGKNGALHNDAGVLAKAAAVSADMARGLRESGWNHDWVRLLEILSTLTREQAEGGNPQPLISAERLRDELSKHEDMGRTWWQSEETGKKKFAKAWRTLAEKLDDVDSNYCTRAIKVGLNVRLRPVDRNIDGRTKGYGLETIAAEWVCEPKFIANSNSVNDSGMANASSQPAQYDAVTVEYREEMDSYPIPWLRKPIKIPLRRTAAIIMVVVITASVLLGLLGLKVALYVVMSDLPLRTIVQTLVLISLVAAMYVYLLLPIYRLIEYGIVPAPDLFQLATPDGQVLLVRREGDLKLVRMVRYTADCPLCGAIHGGRLTIEAGRGEFRGRLVGRCNKSRLEHVFSFDHVLRVGRWLRQR